jgi:hypothetical protein
MKIYSKLLSKIQNNKARVKKVVGIASVAVGLRYGKINSIPTSLSSNSTQQVEQVQNYVEEDIQVIDTDGKVIKTGYVILIGNQEVYQRLVEEREFNLLEENDPQVVLAKSEGNPVTPPTNRGPSNFPTPPSGGRLGRPVYVPKYRIAPKPELGAAANPAGAGNGGGAAEFDDYCPAPNKEQSQKPETFDYRSNSPKKNKKSQDQCSIDEQNKAGLKELPDSENFSYNMDQGRGLKKQAQKVWKNPKAKQEVLRMLERFGDENAKIQEKPLTGFKKLTELKNSGPGPRIFIYRGKNEQPVVVGFCMRNDLDATLNKLKINFT